MAARDSNRTREKPRDVRYPQVMEKGSHPSNGERDIAQIARADGLWTQPQSSGPVGAQTTGAPTRQVPLGR